MWAALALPLVLAPAAWGAALAAGRGRLAPRRGTPRQQARLALLLALILSAGPTLALAAAAPPLLSARLLAGLESAAAEGGPPAEMRLAMARAAAASGAPIEGEGAAAEAARALRAQARALPLLLPAAAGAGALLGLAAAFALGRAGARPRRAAEAASSLLLRLAAAAALLTTLGIVASLVIETARFFGHVRPLDFLLGTRWEPQIAIRADQTAAEGAFGALPVLAGTALVSAVALAVAGPAGLLVALWLNEYAGRRARAAAKPALEILAGVPTVVYGFFAVVALAPLMRGAAADAGVDLAPNSALVAGLVMGVMILPYVSSLSDDALFAVPDDLREAALALGATRLEMLRGAVLPAAFPGVVSALLLALSRALGETMIVVMAAGLAARLTANPLESVTTVTVQIVVLLTGDTEFDNPKTLSAFALGLTLLVLTLALNLAAAGAARRWRRTRGF